MRLNYMTGAQAAQRIGVRPETLYPWLQAKSRPADAKRIVAFLESMPAELGGIMPTGYEYREYKNWRGIPKPRRCPFCKQVKGEIRKIQSGFRGACPNCERTGRGAKATMRRSGRGMEKNQQEQRYKDFGATERSFSFAGVPNPPATRGYPPTVDRRLQEKHPRPCPE